MKIINNTNHRETTLTSAVSIIVDCNDAVELRNMMVRLLEELINNEVLRPQQVARVLLYRFEVTED